MNTKQVVIELPWDIYRDVKYGGLLTDNNYELARKVTDAIERGTVLPENHGRLIDVDRVDFRPGVFLDSSGNPMGIIHKVATIEVLRDLMPAVLEADKAESEE